MSFLVLDSGLVLIPETKAFRDACAANGSPVSKDYLIRYNKAIKYIISQGEWNNLRCLYFDFTNDKNWGLVDLKTPTRTQSKVNTYAGEHTANQGWNGNASFSLLTNYNPSTDTNVGQNNFSFGALFLNNVSATNRHAISAFDSGFAQGIFINEQIPQSTANNSATSPATSYNKFKLTSYAWIGQSRTSSTVNSVYVNGVKTDTHTPSSVAFNNIAIGRLNAYNTSGWAAAATFGSNNAQGCFYAGNGSLNHTVIINAANIFLDGLTTRALVNKRVTFFGDSMSGDPAFASLSNSAQYPKQTLLDLGSGWSGCSISTASRTVATMITEYPTQIRPYRNSSLAKDVLVIRAGTNDIAANASAATAYADIKSLCNLAKADGFKVILIDIIDRDASFSGGQTQGGFDTARASVNSSLAGDFPTSTSVTNVYSGGSYADYLIRVSEDSRYQDATDTTYFQADLVHQTTTADNLTASTYVAPTILLL